MMSCERTGNERPCFLEVDFSVSAGSQHQAQPSPVTYLGKRVAKDDSSVKVPERLSSGLKVSIWRSGE